jgi:hypothetical protein
MTYILHLLYVMSHSTSSPVGCWVLLIRRPVDIRNMYITVLSHVMQCTFDNISLIHNALFNSMSLSSCPYSPAAIVLSPLFYPSCPDLADMFVPTCPLCPVPIVLSSRFVMAVLYYLSFPGELS